LEFFKEPLRIHYIALWGLFLLAVFYTLYLGRDFFLPVTLAFLFGLMLGPAVRGLKRIRVPEPLGAALVLFLLLGVVGYGIYRLFEPAQAWVQKAPDSFRRIEDKLRQIKQPIGQVTKATQAAEKLASFGDAQPTQKVAIDRPGLLSTIFSGTPAFLAQTMVMLIILYFFLASGDLFLRKLINVLPRLEDKKRAVEITRQMETDISTYLAMVTIINFAKGAALCVAMYFIGVPNPLLWGAMAAVLTYIPYIGSLAVGGILTLVAILTFDDTWRIISVPAACLIIDVVEAYIATPLVVGKRLTINPVVLLVWLVFWGWLWGVVGALIAVPLLASFKIICDHLDGFQPISEFIST
jgi:predicted PurR-regulated permease PerM